jgi:hypothetical protein
MNADGSPSSTLLQNRASSSDEFYPLTCARQVLQVATQIGTNLKAARRKVTATYRQNKSPANRAGLSL